MKAVSAVVTCVSMIALQAWSKPSSIARRVDLPASSSSRMRSKISTFESTPMPIVRMNPAIPGSVITASLGGLLLVAIFMLVYYKLSGTNAILSIVLNLLILLAFMSMAGAVMTLPGVAGFILTIGMGVDSNVLIFERIKEELAAGKGPRAAVTAGFDRVFWTIVDTHIASLVAAAFLFQFGTGPIRGFATTLFFGLLSNVFTAVFVSRTLFEFILSRREQPQSLSI
jgi:preprotein translocase subunit SecD